VSSVLVETVTDGAAPVPIGRGTWVPGTRPDVGATLSWLPNVARAEWNYLLPCAMVAAAREGALRVRVTAVDSDGQRAPLGSRVVKGAR
jgi:hypothetical protein